MVKKKEALSALEFDAHRDEADDAVRCFSGRWESIVKRDHTPTMLSPNCPGIDDVEGEKVPEGLPLTVDAHVHIFPGNIFSAIWAWFDENAWPIRYQLSSSAVLAYLLSRGVNHVVALQYAHKPGISRMLNRYMAEKCREFQGRVTGMGAVFPGEE